MHSLRSLWKGLESTPVLAGVEAAWAETAGEDLPVLRPYLLVSQQLADVYPIAKPGGGTCPHRVVVHDASDIVAVCQEVPRTCESLELKKKDIVVHDLDLAGLGSRVRGLLELAGPPPSAVDDLPRTIRVGGHRPMAGLEFSAYLSLLTESVEASEVVERLIARERRPFLYMAPTIDLLDSAALESLRSQRAIALALADFVGADDSDHLVLTRTVADILSGFQPEVLAQARAQRRKGMVLYPVPEGTLWRDLHMYVIDNETVAVTISGSRLKFKFTEMGMGNAKTGNPDDQWELFLKITKYGGRLDRNTPDTGSERKHQRQKLADNFRSFFGIPDDPIPYQKGRRRTKTQPGDISHWKVAFQLHDERGKQHTAAD